MRILRKLIGGSARVMMVALAADILYLYYAGAWIEPNQFIFISEMIMLYGFIVAGIAWTVHYIAQIEEAVE